MRTTSASGKGPHRECLVAKEMNLLKALNILQAVCLVPALCSRVSGLSNLLSGHHDTLTCEHRGPQPHHLCLTLGNTSKLIWPPMEYTSPRCANLDRKTSTNFSLLVMFLSAWQRTSACVFLHIACPRALEGIGTVWHDNAKSC